MVPCLAVQGKVHAVVGQKVVAAEAVGEQVVGAVQDRLGGVFRFHGAGDLNTRIAHGMEPEGHLVGEEANISRSHEAVKAGDDDAAFTISLSAVPASLSR